MNSIQLGWIDYSSEHRNKVMAVLHALSAPGAVDEIGVGQIRDAFANILFPGTSTIQTRAKYFFIVPYILMELEQQKHLTHKSILQKLHEMELDLIDQLKQPGEKGVIGDTAGRKLKRKPSSIYWNGLRTFGIFRYPQLSLEDYAKAVDDVNKELMNHQTMGKQTKDDQQGDDQDACQSRVPGGFWRCLPPLPDWRKHISIHLTSEEANYLKERIIKASSAKNSLLAFLLKCDPEAVQSIDRLEALGKVLDIPESIRIVYDSALRFSDFIYGANLRYNIILSQSKNKVAIDHWDKWCRSSYVLDSFVKYEPDEALGYLRIKNDQYNKLSRFLHNWHKTFLSGDVKAMDELIVIREIEIKKRDRAKLRNPSFYKYREGDGMRGGKLDYRFGNAKMIVTDIFKGLDG